MYLNWNTSGLIIVRSETQRCSFFYVFEKKGSYVHRGCFYLIQNTNTVKYYYDLKYPFYILIYLKK